MSCRFKIFTPFLVVLITAVFSSCSNVVPEKPEDFNWVVYLGDSFSFEYPDNWRLDESGMMGSTCFAFSDKKEKGFTPNINIMIQDLSDQDYTFDEFIEFSQSQMREYATELKVYSSESYKKDGQEYQNEIYSLQQGPKRIMVFQSITLYNSQAYIITYTDMEENYELRKFFADYILESFEIL